MAVMTMLKMQFLGDTPDTYFRLTNNQFAIFPEDVHAPMIGAGGKYKEDGN